MLGVCQSLEKRIGIDRLLFQILFVIWAINDPSAILWYILLAFIL